MKLIFLQSCLVLLLLILNHILYDLFEFELIQEVYKISYQANNFTSLASVVSLQTNMVYCGVTFIP